MNIVAMAVKVAVIAKKLKNTVDTINNTYGKKIKEINDWYKTQMDAIESIDDEFKDIKDQRINDLKAEFEKRMDFLKKKKQEKIDEITASLNSFMANIKSQAEAQMKAAEEEKQKAEAQRKAAVAKNNAQM